ncbi:hypothetical protein [Shewanella xiamenensis]|uniref:hypothetical protein n=2 Tax=Shewanella xiamenensis TaxID=332186 RepID=UPI002E7AE6F2|nr:hypothetical protein [Shewanella xiamenensis]
MEFALIKKWILLSFCLSLMSCGYKGDGDFKSYGYWPLITYELTLPDFPFETGSKHKFDLKGYKSHETSTINIELFSDNEHDFAELDTEVELKIVNDLGVTFFYRKSPLNAHFKRMQELKEASWANEYEWNGRYSYENQDVSDRAVPFSSIEMPAKTKSMRYFNFFPSDAGSLSLTINIGSVPSQFEDLKVRINLSSGWK